MNSKPFAVNYFLPIFLVACFSTALVAWGGQKQAHQQKAKQSISDTVPKIKTDKKVRDLDDVLDDLDNAQFKLNMDKVKTELDEAMKKIDMAKVKMAKP